MAVHVETVAFNELWFGRLANDISTISSYGTQCGYILELYVPVL